MGGVVSGMHEAVLLAFEHLSFGDANHIVFPAEIFTVARVGDPSHNSQKASDRKIFKAKFQVWGPPNWSLQSQDNLLQSLNPC